MRPPSNIRIVPCPHCNEVGTHKGTCELSLMRSGSFWVILAMELPVEQLDTGGRREA